MIEGPLIYWLNVFSLCEASLMATRPSSNGLKAKMSESTLTKIGLYFDSENKVRILDHQSSETTGNLLQECGDFISCK